jgi:5-methylcytosine-specific restriction enzyme A
MYITANQIAEAYKISKNVYESKMSAKDGIDHLSDIGINPTTASIFISDYKYLRLGLVYKRELSINVTDYFIEHIYLDFQKQGLEQALVAMEYHLKYRLPKKMLGIKSIYDKYSKILLSQSNRNAGLSEDEIEQEEVIRSVIKKNKTNKEIKEEIERLNNNKPEIITHSLTSYKRENKAIALIKILRGSKCQICGIGVPKEDGSFYVEAAHIKPKRSGGNEALENIILLCPNHHKEFDLNKQVIQHNGTSINITLSGKTYIVSLS